MGKRAECQTLSGVVPPEFRSLWDGRGVPPLMNVEKRKEKKNGRQENGRSDHCDGCGFCAVVHRCSKESRTDRLHKRKRMYGDQTGRICDLGADPEPAGCKIQGNRCRKCISSDVYSGELITEGKRSCRRLCTGSCMGNPWWTAATAGKTVRQTDIRNFIL